MIILQLNDVGVADELPETPDGGKILIFQDEASGIQVIVPLAAPMAERIGKQLLGRIKIARSIPDIVKPPSVR